MRYLYSIYRKLIDSVYGPPDIHFLEQLRLFELNQLLDQIPISKNSFICELGAGSGFQAMSLASLGFNVRAFDLLTSNYLDKRIFPVEDMGSFSSLKPHSVDIIFTSNVVEHIKDFESFHDECMKKLKSGGLYIHVVPNTTWRTLTIMTYLIKYFHPPLVSHGKVFSTAFHEIFYFNTRYWKKLFSSLEHVQLQKSYCNPILYTGTSLFGTLFSIRRRAALSTCLNTGSTTTFILKRL